MDFSQYAAKNKEEILKEFNTSLETGLSQTEVRKRLKEFGLNEIKERKTKWIYILTRQFKSPFVWLLLIAALLSFLFNEEINACLIIFFVFINVLIGFYQEYHSERIIGLLKKYVSRKTQVLRDGKRIITETNELVLGDIIKVEAGDLIPADIRFLKENDLTVDESILSGESAPIRKISGEIKEKISQFFQAENIGFCGTTVASGEGEAAVLATGENTVLGGIGRLADETIRVSGFEKQVAKLSKFILKIIILSLIFVFAANLLIKGGRVDFAELLVFFIALAVSVIPEALPIVTTFSLSKGALKLAKNKVVVKRLSAIEDLGGIEILCTDKTGTLTENKLTVSEIYPSCSEKTLFYAALANSLLIGKKHTPNNSFDLAIWEALPFERRNELNSCRKIAETPFEPERRRNNVLVKSGEHYELVVRGAPEEIIKLCPGIKDFKSLNQWIDIEGKRGKRVIAVAKKEILIKNHFNLRKEENGLEFLGAVSFFDPLKKTAFEAAQKAEELGIQIKILTGDDPKVAGAVARQIGLIKSGEEVVTGDELDEMVFERLPEILEKFSVFARVSPRQKYKIIQLLQEKKEVGFLGEGINDAPALKIANVAIAVNDASDIARQSADIILLKKNLKVIVDGIAEGRRVFANTLKYIKSTLSSNFGNFYAVAAASLMIDFLPMLPLQILLLNLLSDFPMIAIAADNVDAAELKRPKSHNIKEIASIAVVLGLVSSVFDFIFFKLFHKISPKVLQTNWFIASILTELVFIFSIRTKLLFFKAKKPSKLLLGLSIISFISVIALPYSHFGQKTFNFIKPAIDHIFLILFIVAVYFIVSESAKLIYYQRAREK